MLMLAKMLAISTLCTKCHLSANGTTVQLRSPAITDMLHVFIINWSFYKEIKLKTLSYEQFIVFFVTMQSYG